MFTNKSDSHELVAYVFSNTEVGIDIEYIRPRNNIFKFADRFFSEKEILKLLDTSCSLVEFFKIWTRKEAYLKMLREGLGKRKLSSVCTESIDNIHTIVFKDYVLSIARM